MNEETKNALIEVYERGYLNKVWLDENNVTPVYAKTLLRQGMLDVNTVADVKKANGIQPNFVDFAKQCYKLTDEIITTAAELYEKRQSIWKTQ